VSAGNRLEGFNADADGVTMAPGECTMHAARCNAGIGCFFLVQRFQTLLLNGPFACYHQPIYVDRHGEVCVCTPSC